MPESVLSHARKCLEDGSPHGAVSALRNAAEQNDLGEPPELLAASFAVLAEAALGAGMDELATLCRAAVPLGPQQVYDAGVACLNAGLPRLAIPMLTFVDLAVGEMEGVRAPLASALECAWRHQEAWQLVRDSDCLTGFFADYLLAFNALLAADVEVAREIVTTMKPDPAEPHEADMAERVRQMLSRYDRASAHRELGEDDLRGWHYVMHGGQLLCLSPHGFPVPMFGRFGWLQDDAARIGVGLRRAKKVLEAWDRFPRQVVATPDEGSRYVAGALGRVLDVPVVPWSHGVDGLVAVYDLAQVDADVQLALCDRGDQLLFAHGMRWADAPSTVPDLVTVLAQSLVPPWGERIVIGEAPDLTGTDWVHCIVHDEPTEEPVEEDSNDALVAFAAAVGPCSGQRRYWGIGPVSSLPIL